MDGLKKVIENLTRILNLKDPKVTMEKYKTLRQEQLQSYSTKELMDELRRRGKTVGKKMFK